MGVTQYTFSAEQQERVVMSSAATMTVNSVDRTIMTAEKNGLCLYIYYLNYSNIHFIKYRRG